MMHVLHEEGAGKDGEGNAAGADDLLGVELRFEVGKEGVLLPGIEGREIGQSLDAGLLGEPHHVGRSAVLDRVVAPLLPPSTKVDMNAMATFESPAQRSIIFKISLIDGEGLSELLLCPVPLAGVNAHVETIFAQLPTYGLPIVAGSPYNKDGL